MENVNSKNKKLTIIVGALLLVVGISFAYFIATTLINGKGSSVVGTTARIKGAEINVEGTLEFNDTDVYPGHKNVSAIKITATGNNQLIPYNLIWKGESGISQINFTVYKSATSLNVTTNCTKKTGVQNGMQVLSEECTITNIDTLGEAIANGSIYKGDTREILAQDEFITALSNGSTVYYYVVLEYPNLDEDQSNDANATFQGEVTVEESEKQADINILAVYVADDNGNYTETTDIPQSGYFLNSEKSTCSNGTVPGWNVAEHMFYTTNLTKSGTSCYLYFDKAKAINDIIATLNAKSETPDFSQVATTNEGVYAVEDGMYGGTSYYWRGAATTNYVKFANFCWRIVRINGDKTMRLIYDGTTCHANGTNTVESLAITKQTYSKGAVHDRSEYVGYTYTVGSQRGTAEESNLKTQTESWYKANITDRGYDGQVATGKFCNDRETTSGYTWESQPSSSTFFYAALGRLESAKTPTLSCPSEDIYTLKVGSITADEVSFAGGESESENSSYYLYNGQNYWTMSPHRWYGTYAPVFSVYSNGRVNAWHVGNTTPGVRPVINLRSDVTFSSGNGTLDTPYIVAD